MKNATLFNDKKGLFGSRENIAKACLITILLGNTFYLGFRTYEQTTLKQINSGNLEKVALVKNKLVSNYLFSDEVSNDQIVDGMIEGMVKSMGDPYTRYISQRDYEEFKVDTQGSFGGIGVTINSSNTEEGIVIQETNKGESADSSGLLPNDIIIAVDGEPITGMEASEAVALIKGEVGTNVVLTVKREGVEDPIQITIKRQEVEIPVVDAVLLDNNVGYIRYSNFTGTSINQFDKAYDKLLEEGMEALVLDLRDNTGGLVNIAVELSSRFLEDGQEVLEIDSKKASTSVTTVETPYKIDMPVAVLVNHYSASASEIFAGALQDYSIATIVGEKTYGKGLVQDEIPIDEDSALIVTTGRYLTPAKQDINKNSIVPDIEIAITKEDFIQGIDTQLNEAHSVLVEKLK